MISCLTFNPKSAMHSFFLCFFLCFFLLVLVLGKIQSVGI